MKQTLAEGKVTKGNASHDSNPMPIMSTGAVLDKEGKDTGLKADNGAGIYHQASKQFKPGMTWTNHTRYGWHIDHIISLSHLRIQISALCL